MAQQTVYQIQLTDNTGAQEVLVYPINTDLDTLIQNVDDTGTLTLPGAAQNETLAVTLKNIRKYLTNLANVAAEVRQVSDAIDSESSVNLATSAAVKDALDAVSTTLQGYAVTDHAANNLTYGGGTATNYGHVKLTDTYSLGENETASAAADSVAASQKALTDAYDALVELIEGIQDDLSDYAPVSHATNDLTYGGGTATNYGHVKLTDAYTVDTEQGETAGTAAGSVAASQKSVVDAYTAAMTALNTHAQNSVSFIISSTQPEQSCIWGRIVATRTEGEADPDPEP